MSSYNFIYIQTKRGPKTVKLDTSKISVQLDRVSEYGARIGINYTYKNKQYPLLLQTPEMMSVFGVCDPWRFVEKNASASKDGKVVVPRYTTMRLSFLDEKSDEQQAFIVACEEIRKKVSTLMYAQFKQKINLLRRPGDNLTSVIKDGSEKKNNPGEYYSKSINVRLQIIHSVNGHIQYNVAVKLRSGGKKSISDINMVGARMKAVVHFSNVWCASTNATIVPYVSYLEVEPKDHNVHTNFNIVDHCNDKCNVDRDDDDDSASDTESINSSPSDTEVNERKRGAEEAQLPSIDMNKRSKQE